MSNALIEATATSATAVSQLRATAQTDRNPVSSLARKCRVLISSDGTVWSADVHTVQQAPCSGHIVGRLLAKGVVAVLPTDGNAHQANDSDAYSSREQADGCQCDKDRHVRPAMGIARSWRRRAVEASWARRRSAAGSGPVRVGLSRSMIMRPPCPQLKVIVTLTRRILKVKVTFS